LGGKSLGKRRRKGHEKNSSFVKKKLQQRVLREVFNVARKKARVERVKK